MNYEIFNHNHRTMASERLLSIVLIGSVIAGVRGQQCDLPGSLQCVTSFSSLSKFSSYTEDFQGNITDLVSDTCLKLENLYECVGDKLLGCAPQYRLIYETALSAGRFICRSGKQGFIDNFRCLVLHNLQNNSISCGGKIITVIRELFSNPATILPDLTSRADELCIRANDTLKCVVKATSIGCGPNAVSFIQEYMESFTAPLKSFFSCVDEMEEPYSYKTSTDIVPNVTDSKYHKNGLHDSRGTAETTTLFESAPTFGLGMSKPDPMENFRQADKTSGKTVQGSTNLVQQTAKFRKVAHRDAISITEPESDFPANVNPRAGISSIGKSTTEPVVIQSHLDTFSNMSTTPEPEYQENVLIAATELPETDEPEQEFPNQPSGQQKEANFVYRPTQPEQLKPASELLEPTGTPEPTLPEPDYLTGTPEPTLPEPYQQTGTPEPTLPEPYQQTGTPEPTLPEPYQQTGTPEPTLPEPYQQTGTPEPTLPQPYQQTGTPEPTLPQPYQQTGTPEPTLPEPVPTKPISEKLVPQNPNRHSLDILSTPQPRPKETVTSEPDEPLPEPVDHGPQGVKSTKGQNAGTTPDPQTTQSANQRSPHLQPKGRHTAIPHTIRIQTTPLPVIRNVHSKTTRTRNNIQTTVNESKPEVIRVRIPIRFRRLTSSSTTTTIAPVILAKISRTCKKYCFRFRDSSIFTMRQKQHYDVLCDRTCRAGKCPSRVCSSSCGCPRTLKCRYTGPRRRWAGDHWCNNLCRNGSPLCRRTQCNCHYA